MRADVIGIESDLPVSAVGPNRVLARGLTGVFLASMFAFLLIRVGLYSLPLAEPTVLAITTVAFVLFALAAPLACAFAARIAPRQERRGWVLLAVGTGLMVLGDAIALATGGAAALGAAPTTPVPGVIWITSYVAFFAAMLGFIDPVPMQGLSRWRRGLDVFLVVLLIAAIMFAVVLFPVYGTNPRVSVVSALPTFVSLVFSLSLIAVALTSKVNVRFWHLPLLAALVAIGVGSLTELLMPLSESVATWRAAIAPAIDMPWLIAYAMVTLAAFVRIRQRHVEPYLQEVKLRGTRRWVSIALMTTAFVAMPAFVFLGFSWTGEATGFWLFMGVAMMLALVAMGRNIMLSAENATLKEHALIDPLTELYNHRFFQERLETEIERARREDTELSLVVADVDDFDQVNNAYGHSVGDARLAAIAARLSESARSTDVVCRVGGDAFAVIMPNTSTVSAYKVSLRLQDSLEDVDDGCPLPVRISAGIAGAPGDGRDREQLASKANGALYWAKLNGREQVVVYDPELVTSTDPEQRIKLIEEESYVRMVQMLASAVDARDPYTQQHSRRVASFAVMLGEAAGLDKDGVRRLETAALLHDVGKIGVPDAVLRKNGRLSEDEYEQVKEHPFLATRILSAIPKSEILPWISSHHEHWDGSGYPDGLSAEDIPYEARILSICDAFDAMTSARPYREAMPEENALKELERCAGTQFDAGLTQIFVTAVRASDGADQDAAASAAALSAG